MIPLAAVTLKSWWGKCFILNVFSCLITNYNTYTNKMSKKKIEDFSL